MNQNILYLASSSPSRKELVKSMGIKFEVIKQNAHEDNESYGRTLAQLVCDIAIEKMDHIILPKETEFENNTIFILTADTLTQDKFGNIHGKPTNYEDAIHKIKVLSDNALVATGFCLDKKRFINGQWKTIDRTVDFIEATCILDIPDNFIEQYTIKVDALNIAGAIEIEGFGMQFTKSINGSYSGILGLPLFELRIALEKMGFYCKYSAVSGDNKL